LHSLKKISRPLLGKGKKTNKPPTPLNPKIGIKPKGTLSPLTHNTKESGKEKGTLTQLKMNKLVGREKRNCAP